MFKMGRVTPSLCTLFFLSQSHLYFTNTDAFTVSKKSTAIIQHSSASKLRTNDKFTSSLFAENNPQNQNVIPFPSFLSSLFNNKSIDKSKNDELVQKRLTLKKELLDICQNQQIGGNNYSTNEKRKLLEGIIQQLKDLRPIQDTAVSPLLRKQWLLIWTTEKEINFFIDWKISEKVTQTILPTTNILTNSIDFKLGGGLYVEGKLSIADEQETKENSSSLLRTNFEFISASIDLGDKWGKYSIPPVGKGWFDTLYLDDDLRVDLNSRNDILICSPVADE